MQREILAEHFGDLDACKERRRRVYRLIAAEMSGEPMMLRCMKVLGVGLISAFALLAVIGDECRFERPEKLVAYIELNPASAKAARARTSNSAWAKEAVGIPHLPAYGNTSKFSSLHDYMAVLCG